MVRRPRVRRVAASLALLLGLLASLVGVAPAAGAGHAADADGRARTRVVTFASEADADHALDRLDEQAATLTPRAIAVPLDDRGAAELAGEHDVVAVEDDHTFHAAELDPRVDDPCVLGCGELSSWYLDELGVDDAWTRTHGAGVLVAVVDTGIAEDHPELAGQLAGPEIDIIGGPRNTGHGTAVAGLVGAAADNGIGLAGVARDARLLSVRVLGSSGSGPLSAVAKGVVAATNAGADVINLSLTGDHSVALADAVAYAVDNGAIVVAAAGNEASSTPRYPAAFPGVIAVGATGRDLRPAGFSNEGPWVDVYAPGASGRVGLPTTSLTGDIVSFTGTSAAAPIVSGVAALARAHTPLLDSPTAETLLRRTAGRTSGVPVVDAGAATAAPGLYPDEANSPFGRLDSVAPAPGGFAIRGWAIDPNTKGPIAVHVYATGKGVLATARAEASRFDIPLDLRAPYGRHHGFERAFGAGSGPYEICAYGIDEGAGRNAKLGCTRVERASGGTGHLDEIRRLDRDTVRVRGWALDREKAAPTDIHVYVAGGERSRHTAADARGDIARAFPGWGADHGFDVEVRARRDQRVCVYAISPAGNNLAGCATA